MEVSHVWLTRRARPRDSLEVREKAFQLLDFPLHAIQLLRGHLEDQTCTRPEITVYKFTNSQSKILEIQ